MSWRGGFEPSLAEIEGGSGDRLGKRNIEMVWLLVPLSALLRSSMFPPWSFSEAAYFFLVPLLFPNWGRRPLRSSFLWGWVAGFLFWFFSIIWLRHVTFGGMIGLSAVLACFTGIWMLGLAVFRKRTAAREGAKLVSLGFPVFAAALWVLLEWSRTWILWGFPWNPVSVSQWNRPAVLSVVPFTGGWGLSFLLVWINVALSEWIRLPFTGWKKKGMLPFARNLPIGLILPIGVLVAGAAVYFWNSRGIVSSAPVRVGFVQPYSTMKWESGEVSRNLRRIWEETRNLGEGDPQIILWPESATPIPVIGDPSLRAGVESLSRDMESPILMGNMAWYPEEGIYENAVFLVEPDGGLMGRYYVKRNLVPFGEFIPFRQYLPFLEKIVPIGLDCRPGEEAVVFPFPTPEGAPRQDRVGPLICYEDVFPALARDTVDAGADWLFVATNNVWYGEEAGAYQHAAHSVLRAVETRRPVLRSGNGGWSGWIDEWGHVRKRVEDASGSIYFRGSETVAVSRDLRFESRRTSFVRWGDWFVAVCGLIAGVGFFRLFYAGRNSYSEIGKV